MSTIIPTRSQPIGIPRARSAANNGRFAHFSPSSSVSSISPPAISNNHFLDSFTWERETVRAKTPETPRSFDNSHISRSQQLAKIEAQIAQLRRVNISALDVKEAETLRKRIKTLQKDKLKVQAEEFPRYCSLVLKDIEALLNPRKGPVDGNQYAIFPHPNGVYNDAEYPPTYKRSIIKAAGNTPGGIPAYIDAQIADIKKYQSLPSWDFDPFHVGFVRDAHNYIRVVTEAKYPKAMASLLRF